MDRAQVKAWFGPAILFVALVTGLRLILLVFNRTDLFVDESQYWFWGQNPAFGYFSKPPMIAWLIRAVTWAAGSDATFWVRMPGALLHGATALILGGLAARIAGARTAFWTSAGYVTLPMAAVGSLLISTDTVMAPFYAAAILFYHRLLERHRMQDAVLTGVMLGLALLSKYAAIYLPIGMALAAIRRELRPSLAEVATIAAIALVIIAPNFEWNLTHKFSTLTATGQNIGWVNQADPLSRFDLRDVLDFWSTQLAVAGPLVITALVAGFLRFRRQPLLVALTLPPLAVVSVQSVLYHANANWAVGSYFAGSVLAAVVLANFPRWRLASFLCNAAVSTIFPLLTLFPALSFHGQPILHRYLGRADFSRQIVALAHSHGVGTIVTDSRPIIADLNYTEAHSGLSYYAVPPVGKPSSHYEQFYALPAEATGPVLLVSDGQPDCPATRLPLDVSTAPYDKTELVANLVDANCARHIRPEVELAQ